MKPLKLDPSKTMDEFATRLATLTPGYIFLILLGFSGAEIANLCNEAAILAARNNKLHVESIDFELASERIIGNNKVIINSWIRKKTNE